MMKYTGGCHCGKIRFEVEMKIDSVISCNCSICSKRGHLLAFAPQESFNLLSGQESLKDYQFGKKNIHHHFCSECGVSAFGAGEMPNGKKMRSVNVRCLDGVDFSKIPVHQFDGKSL